MDSKTKSKMTHKQDCPKLQAWDHGDHEAPCTCGLDEAVERTKALLPGGKQRHMPWDVEDDMSKTKSKMTPGPWAVGLTVKDRAGALTGTGWACTDINGPEGCFLEIRQYHEAPEREANAHAIAKLPELIEEHERLKEAARTVSLLHEERCNPADRCHECGQPHEAHSVDCAHGRLRAILASIDDGED